MRIGMVVLALSALLLTQTALAADVGKTKPLQAATSYLALQRLGDAAAIRIDLTKGDLRQAFVLALQGNPIWQEVQAVPEGNVLGILPAGIQLTLSADSDVQNVVVLDASETLHTFVRGPMPTALAAFQSLCNVFIDANYDYNVFFPGPYPHVFGYIPAACEFSFNQSP